jgi:hypothetical protein
MAAQPHSYSQISPRAGLASVHARLSNAELYVQFLIKDFVHQFRTAIIVNFSFAASKRFTCQCEKPGDLEKEGYLLIFLTTTTTMTIAIKIMAATTTAIEYESPGRFRILPDLGDSVEEFGASNFPMRNG